VIELASAGFRYGAQDIFSRVEVNLQPGSFHFLTGPSGAGKTTFLKQLDDLLAWVDLEGRADALPPELSGGERQRAALARAVILAPDMIIADEPTGNIDWDMAIRVLTLLTELNKMGRTILVATHDMNLIRAARQKVSARVLRLSGGQLTQAGSDL